MQLVARAFSQTEWAAIIAEFADLNLIQTWEYAEAKAQGSMWRVERAIFVEGDCIVGAVQALSRRVPWLGTGMVWISRGPLWRRAGSSDSASLLAMMNQLRIHWAENRHLYLRVLMPALEGDIDPGQLNAVGYRQASTHTWASARLDLSLSLEQLRQQLRPRWRSYLNQFEKQGFIASSSADDSAFDTFLAGYGTMVEARRFKTSVTPALLSRIQRLLPSDRKLLVFTAHRGARPLGAALIARYGTTCEYLAGTIDEAGRNDHAGLFLLWHAICAMKEIGYRRFDLGGLHPQRTPRGIFQFKSGFGAAPYQFVGELEAHGGNWRTAFVRRCVQIAR